MTDSRPVRLIASARQRYAGRWISIGQQFEVDNQRDADDLVAMRFAMRAPVTCDLSAEQPAAAEAPAKTRRHYKRRDLEAER